MLTRRGWGAHSKFERRKLEDVYSDRKEAWLREREEHSVALKPSLGNSNARAELDALCDAENKRSEPRLVGAVPQCDVQQTSVVLLDRGRRRSFRAWSMMSCCRSNARDAGCCSARRCGAGWSSARS